MEESSYKAREHYQKPDVAAGYDAERFASLRGRFVHRMESGALDRVIRKYFQLGRRVLDIPCGTGRLLDVYGPGGFDVTGVDISTEMLKIARQRFGGNGRYTFDTCDAEHLAFPVNSFDYLVSFRFMAHLPPDVRGRVLAEMARVTREILVVNYYLDVVSPVAVFNSIFRPKATRAPYPVKPDAVAQEAAACGLEIVEVIPLSWFERAASLVVMRKK